MFGLFKKNKEKSIIEERGKGKVYKIINNSSIVGMFAAVSLLVLMITGIINWHSTWVGIIIGIAVLCICCNLALPWILRVERKEFVKLSYVFIGLIAVCAILWISCDIVVISQYIKIKNAINSNVSDAESIKIIKNVIGSMNFLKVAFCLSLQFSVASFVATYITRFKKEMIPLQVIAYISYIIIDVWVTSALFSLNIRNNFEEISKVSKIIYINLDLLKFLISKYVIVALILAVVYIGISKVIMNKVLINKRLKVDDKQTETISSKTDEKTSNSNISSRLEQLKEMLDKNLITQEEYNKKREEILKDI